MGVCVWKGHFLTFVKGKSAVTTGLGTQQFHVAQNALVLIATETLLVCINSLSLG